jgi:hypothetical protein
MSIVDSNVGHIREAVVVVVLLFESALVVVVVVHFVGLILDAMQWCLYQRSRSCYVTAFAPFSHSMHHAHVFHGGPSRWIHGLGDTNAPPTTTQRRMLPQRLSLLGRGHLLGCDSVRVLVVRNNSNYVVPLSPIVSWNGGSASGGGSSCDNIVPQPRRGGFGKGHFFGSKQSAAVVYSRAHYT